MVLGLIGANLQRLCIDAVPTERTNLDSFGPGVEFDVADVDDDGAGEKQEMVLRNTDWCADGKFVANAAVMKLTRTLDRKIPAVQIAKHWPINLIKRWFCCYKLNLLFSFRKVFDGA